MDDPRIRAFGRRVRTLRKERLWTQAVLADFAGLHGNYVSQLERGERNVGLANVLKLADALGVAPGTLFEWEKWED